MTVNGRASCLPVLIVGVSLWTMPALTRPTVQFGVRIPDHRVTDEVIRQERRRYRRRIAVLTICSAALAVLLAPQPGRLTGIVVPLQLVSSLECFWLARRRIAEVKAEQHWYEGLRQTVTTDTSWRTEPEHFPMAWSVPAAAVCVVTFVVGVIRYPHLPPRLAGVATARPALPGTVGVLALLVVTFRTGQAGSRLPRAAVYGATAVVDRDDDRFWKGGLVYVNRDDPALLVGKRFGIGWTLNLGNPRAWLLLGGIVALTTAMCLGLPRTASAQPGTDHLTAVPATDRATAVPATDRATVVPATDREITFVVDGTTTYGTVHVPAHRRGERLPAALLLPGSGPTDRNGDEPPSFLPGTLARLSTSLGQDDVLTLRFDKYGSGRTGLGRYQDHPETIDYPAFVRQARAAYALLSRQREADPRRLLIVGHSEGGLTALVLAGSTAPRPAAVALLEPQALRLLDLIARQLHDQVTQAFLAGQLTPEQRVEIDHAVDGAITAVRAGRSPDTTFLPPAFADLFRILTGVNQRFVLSDDAVRPASLVGRLRPGTRVLLTCGTEDTQVPCSATDALTAALGRARIAGPGRVVLPHVDHLLHDVRRPQPAQQDPLAPALLLALHAFLASARQGISAGYPEAAGTRGGLGALTPAPRRSGRGPRDQVPRRSGDGSGPRGVPDAPAFDVVGSYVAMSTKRE